MADEKVYKKITIHPVNDDKKTVNPDLSLLPVTTVDQISILQSDNTLTPAKIVLADLSLSTSPGQDIGELTPRTSQMSLSIQQNYKLYVYNEQTQDSKKVSLNELDYSKITVIQDGESLDNVRIKDFAFCKTEEI